MSVDMDICSESSGNEEEGEEEDDEELDLLLNSLNGIEKCFLPNDTENLAKKTEDVSILNDKDLTNTAKPPVLDNTGENVANRSDKDDINISEKSTLHNSSFHEDVIEDNFNGKSEDVVPLPQKPIESRIVHVLDDECTLSSDDQKSNDLIIDTSRENSDSDVIVDKVCDTESNDNAIEELLPLVKSSKTENIKPVSPLKLLDSSDSDVDIVEHIKGSPFLKKGFIDLTLEDESAKGIEQNVVEIDGKDDDTEMILKEIDKIKKALLKHKKKKRKKKKKGERNRSRTRSSSRLEFVDSDEDKIQTKVCSSIELPFGRTYFSKSKSISPGNNHLDDRLQRFRDRSPSNERTNRSHSRTRLRARSRGRSRAPSRPRSRAHSRTRSRARSRIRSRAQSRARSRPKSRTRSRSRSRARSRSRRSWNKYYNEIPQHDLKGRSKSRSRFRRKKSTPPDSDMHIRRRESPLESIRKKLRKENESAVESLMSVNSVHQQTVIREGNQTFTDVRTSTVIQEILTTADRTQSFTKDQTSVSLDSNINRQVMMDSHTTHGLVASSNAPQIPPSYDTRLEPSYPDYAYPQAGQTMNYNYHHGYYSQVTNVVQINRLCPNYLNPYHYYYY